MSKKPLKLMRLLDDKRIKPQVVFGCAEETRADIVGLFFGKVMAMEGLKTIPTSTGPVLSLRKGGSTLSRHTCEKLCSDLPEPYQTGLSLVGQLKFDIAVSFAFKRSSYFY